jgi:uncharacterized protein YndB with AHSA1/START domain
MDIDVVATIGATERRVAHMERDGQPVHRVEARRAFGTGQEDLWDALTNPERIPRWFLPISGELRVGGRYQLEGNAGGEIVHCEPPRAFSVTWEFGGGMSWVDVELAADDAGGTLLTLAHTVPDDDHWRQYGAGATGMGWDMGLLGLAAYLAAGSVDSEAAMAWMMSPAGLDFMRRSSAEWRDAAVAGGTPADTADEAARETLAFYSGGAA